MKTRYSSLVSVKKNIMQKSERVLQTKNFARNNAKEALTESFSQLEQLQSPKSGLVSDFLSSRALLDLQRSLIRHNEEWLAFATKEVQEAQEQLKRDMIEYEKFQYLEVQEVEALKQQQKIKEAKELDEVALITHNNNKQRSA